MVEGFDSSPRLHVPVSVQAWPGHHDALLPARLMPRFLSIHDGAPLSVGNLRNGLGPKGRCSPAAGTGWPTRGPMGKVSGSGIVPSAYRHGAVAGNRGRATIHR